jgi:hypothetical protein
VARLLLMIISRAGSTKDDLIVRVILMGSLLVEESRWKRGRWKKRLTSVQELLLFRPCSPIEYGTTTRHQTEQYLDVTRKPAG